MASQGPNSPNTCADDATVGTVAWSNPNNAKVSDNIYSLNYVTYGGVKISHYLKATNFNFSIPRGATINGILVEIERKQYDEGAIIQDSDVKIIKSDNTIGIENKADIGISWPFTDTYKSYGSSSDLWGENWLYSDINSSNFGVVLSVTGEQDRESPAQVDHIRITIYYTEAIISPFPTFFQP
jgi:hypothetical protein